MREKLTRALFPGWAMMTLFKRFELLLEKPTGGDKGAQERLGEQRGEVASYLPKVLIKNWG